MSWDPFGLHHGSRAVACIFKLTRKRNSFQVSDRYFKFLEAAQKGENPLFERYIRRITDSEQVRALDPWRWPIRSLP